MFENESAAVKNGIGFLSALIQKDFKSDPSFDLSDLKEKLSEIQADVYRLKSNLPYEAIDDEEEREHQYPAEFEDTVELEDEIVECDRLIAQAQQLIIAVKNKYFSEDEEIVLNINSRHSKFLGHYFKHDNGKKERYINWSNVILLALIAGLIIWVIIKDFD